MKLVGLLAILVTGALLLAATADFPDWGDPRSPANDSPTSNAYLANALVETEVPNVVTAVLADYRSFDTLFETVVILTAGLSIIAILKIAGPRPSSAIPGPECPGDDDLIVTTTARLIVPAIQIFALYVVAHGHHSPGGGFQGGVIFGASFILFALAHGLPATTRRFSEGRAVLLAAVGVLIFAGIGLLCMLLGGNFLDYGVLHRILPATGETWARSHSVLGVEIGVAFTVTAIMFAIYANLSSRGKLEGGL